MPVKLFAQLCWWCVLLPILGGHRLAYCLSPPSVNAPIAPSASPLIEGGASPSASPNALSATTSTAINATVCAATVEPFVYCNATSASKDFTGFDVEMFRRAANQLNMVEGVNYTFVCLPFSQMITDIGQSNGTCDIGIGSITITLSREQQGIQFAFPYLNSGLGILVKSAGYSTSGWNWIKPFSVNLWIAVLLTIAIFPLFIFVIEFGSLKRRIQGSDVVPGMTEATWRSVWTLIGLERLDVSSLGARVAAIAFGFMALILVNTYTANLAAVLTVSQINSQIRSVNDLRGRAVLTNAIYVPGLRTQYGIVASVLDFNSVNDVVNAASSVIDGSVAAVISDDVVIKSAVSQIPYCQVLELPNTILPFSYGIGFKVGTNPSLVSKFSAIILMLSEDGDLQSLANSFLPSDSPCGGITSTSNSISFDSLYGLWVMLGCGVALGSILMVVARWRRRMLKRLTSGAVLPTRARLGNMVEFDSEERGSATEVEAIHSDEQKNTASTTQNGPTVQREPAGTRASHLQQSSSLFGHKVQW